MVEGLTLSRDLLETTKQQNVGEIASHAFVHSLAQSPLNGAVQLVDKALGSNILPSVQFVEAPRQAEFGSVNWHAQQVGQAAGMVPWFVGLHKGSSALVNRCLGVEAKAAAGLALEKGFLKSNTSVEIGASALSGLGYGAILSPTRHGDDFVAARLATAGSSALTFATLAGSARGLTAMGLKQPVLVGVLSGVPAGIVAAESHSLLSGNGFASGKDVAQSVYGFALIGGAFGYAQGRFERATTRLEPQKLSTHDRGGTTDVAGSPAAIGELSALSRRISVEPSGEPSVRAGQSAEAQKPQSADGAQSIRQVELSPADQTILSEVRNEMNGVARAEGPFEVRNGQEQSYRSTADGRLEFAVLRQTGDTMIATCSRTGAIVLERNGQPWLAELADGKRITMESAGPWEVATPSRKVITKDADGHLTIKDWQGDLLHKVINPQAPRYEIVLGAGPSGYPLMRELPKSLTPEPVRVIGKSSYLGDRKLFMSDGTRVEQPKSGPWEAFRPDGSKFSKESPGPWEIITYEGTAWSKDAAGVLRQSSENGSISRAWHPDGTVESSGTNYDSGIKYTEIEKPGSITERIYEDPSAAGQVVTQLGVLRQGRINSDWDWKATDSAGKEFAYDSAGPWSVTLLDGAKLSKDALGSLKLVEGARVTEFMADGTKIFTDANGVKTVKPDGSRTVLYSGSNTLLRFAPDGKQLSSINISPRVESLTPQPQMSDPFSSNDYW